VRDCVYNLLPNFKNLKHLILFHVTSFHAHFVTQNTTNAAYSTEKIMLNKQQISGGGAYPDCYYVVVPILGIDPATRLLIIKLMHAVR